jgi:hypothetical protein
MILALRANFRYALLEKTFVDLAPTLPLRVMGIDNRDVVFCDLHQVWIDQMEALRLAAYTKDFVDAVDHVAGPVVPHPYFSTCVPTTASDRIKEYERLDQTLTGLIRESERKIAALETISLAQSGPLDPELALTINFRRSALMCRTMTFINLVSYTNHLDKSSFALL